MSARSAPSVVRVKIGCPDLPTYLDRHAFEYAKYGLFIPSPRPEARPLGARVHLKIQLADGTFGYSGPAVVAHHVLDATRPGYLLHFAEAEVRIEPVASADPAAAIAGTSPALAAPAHTPPPLPALPSMTPAPGRGAAPVQGFGRRTPVPPPGSAADLDDEFEEVTDSAILARELPRPPRGPDLLEALFGPEPEDPAARGGSVGAPAGVEAAPGSAAAPFAPLAAGGARDARDPFAPASAGGSTPDPFAASRRTPAPSRTPLPPDSRRTPAPSRTPLPPDSRRTPAPSRTPLPPGSRRTPAPSSTPVPPGSRRTPTAGSVPGALVPPVLTRDPFAVPPAASTPAVPVRDLIAALDAAAPAPARENLRAPLTPAPTRGDFGDEATRPVVRFPERRSESLTTRLGLGPRGRPGRFRMVTIAVAAVILSAAGAGFAVGQRRTVEAEASFATEIATADDRVRTGRLAAPAGDSALDHLDAARRILPGDLRVTSRGKLLADTFESLGRHALARGDLKEAAVHFTSALRAEPNRASARAQLETLARISPRRLGGTP